MHNKNYQNVFALDHGLAGSLKEIYVQFKLVVKYELLIKKNFFLLVEKFKITSNTQY